VYVGGFAVWLLYGMGIGDVPIIVVHAVGLLCGTVTLAVALRLRGPAAVGTPARLVGEDRARARPGRPSPREPEHRGLPLGVRVGSVERIGTLDRGPYRLRRTPSSRSSQNNPSTRFGE
jgi:hypothetical protein